MKASLATTTLGICLTALALSGCGGQDDRPATQTMAMTGTGAQTATPATAYYPALQQIYIAYFGRPADPGGLEFYARNLAASGAPTDVRGIVDSAGQNAVVRALLDGYGDSAESKALYGTDTTAFVNAVYRNLLGRAPDLKGLNHWRNAINSGGVTRATAAFWILVGATGPGNTDGDLIRVKLAAASAFTAAMKTAEQRSAYAGSAAITKARTYLSGLTVAQNLALLPGKAQALVDDLVIAANPNRVILRGTVAMGAPVQDAWVDVWDQDGPIGEQVRTLADGTYMVSADLQRRIRPPIVSKARFTNQGKGITLFSTKAFSVSTNEKPGSLTLNMSPVTDMIARAYAAAQDALEPAGPFDNESVVLEAIKRAARRVFAPLLPVSVPDPIDDPMVADPAVDPWDNVLEKVDIARQGAGTAISTVGGKLIAAVPDEALASGVVADTVTSVEAFQANQARGPIAGPVKPIVNESDLPAPRGFKAVKKDGLNFVLSWDRVPEAERYFIYEQKDTPYTISPGTYANTQHVPNYATGGNANHDVEFDYHVDGPGRYFWVIAAVMKDGQLRTFTLGEISDPVSLRFGDAPPPPDPKPPTDPVTPGGTGFSDWVFMQSDKPVQQRWAVERMDGTVATVRVQYRVLKSDEVHCTSADCDGYLVHFSYRPANASESEKRDYWFTRDFDGPWESAPMKLDFKTYSDGSRLKWTKDLGVRLYDDYGVHPQSWNYKCVDNRLRSTTRTRCPEINFNSIMTVTPTTP